MKIMIFILYNLLLMSSCVLQTSADYSYSNADEWQNENPQCGGSKQSPIDVFLELQSFDDLAKETIYEIQFEHIFTTVPKKMILNNDGHTLKLLFELADNETNIPQVHGELLGNDYTLHSFQFRWSSDINSGSEHHTNGQSYPMEMQCVHYNSEFDSYEDAESSEKGILIYSMFYVIGSEEFEFLTKITEKIPEVTEPGTSTEIEPFVVGDFFGENDSHSYMVYDGSLTHPPCYESVVWIISDQIVPATKEQIQAFQKLNLLNNDDHNNRPLQENNGRKLNLARKA